MSESENRRDGLPPEEETEKRRDGETATSPTRPVAVSPVQSSLPPGLTPEQLAAHERRLAARERAAVVPLPGPLGDAFACCAGSSESANGRDGAAATSPSRPLAVSPVQSAPPFRLRPVSLRDFITLRAWQHPLYDELCGADPRRWTQPELDQACALFNPQSAGSLPSDLRPLTSDLCFLPSDLRPLTSAFRALFHQAFSTVLSFVPVNRDGPITITSGPEDGVGWWLSLYRFLVMDCHFASDAALDYPLGQAWALRAAHHDRNPLLELDGDGYMAQEVMRNA